MKVKFIPQNVEYEIAPNQTVLQLAQANDLHIKSVCKGIPSCAECRIQIAEGEYNVMPPSQAELNLIGTAHFVDHRRLACQLRCFGDITVDLSEQEQKQAEVVSSKRPRGYVHKAAGEESRAVMGNIMQDLEEQSRADLNERTANITLQEEEIRRELERVKMKKNPREKSGGESRGPRHSGQNRSQRHDRHSSRSEGSTDTPQQARPARQDRPQRPNRVEGEQPPQGAEQKADGQGPPSEGRRKRNRNRNRNRRPRSGDKNTGEKSGLEGQGKKSD